MGKEPVLDRVELRTVRRIVGHANLSLNALGQLLQPMFEHVPPRRIAAAAIAQKQDLFRVGIGESPVLIPPPRDALAGETTRVVTESEIQVAAVALAIVDAMRVNDTGGQLGEIAVLPSTLKG